MEERIGIQIIVMLEIILVIIQYHNYREIIYSWNRIDFEVRIHEEVFSADKRIVDSNVDHK